jgi:uncharacterized protein (TIGR03085 family)
VTDYSRRERRALCDLMDAVGPDHPTLCTGWATYDLAAHLWVRESDPMAGPGLIIPALSDTTDRRMAQAKQRWPYPELVDKIRNGPPKVSVYGLPFIGSGLNTFEYFVHHEDVRRAEADAEPRDLPAGQQDQLWSRLKQTGRGLVRKSPTGLVVRRPGGETAELHGPTDAGTVIVDGEPAELVLFAFGRGQVARVELEGAEQAVTALRGASFGI